MKYQGEITIAAEPEFVWNIFDDLESTRIWQPYLKTYKQLSGTAGEVGSVYELVFDNNGRDIKAIATLTEKREYEVMASSIDSESSFATVVNRFEPIGNNQTRWIFSVEYRFKGLYRLVAFFLRKSMRTRAANEMRNFKQLVESRLADEKLD
jgi:hypothetical protein